MNQIVPAVAAATVVPQSFAEVRAPLTFIRPQSGKPVFHSSALTGGEARFYFETEDHEVAIEDLRPFADSLSLDREGFVLRHHPTAVADLYNDTAVARDYYAETEAFLQREFGASRVVIFDATRRSDNTNGAKNPDGLRGPASRIHVDYTTKSGPQRLKDNLGEAEAEGLLKKGARIQQINVWRPIRGPVERKPLALADAASVRPRDLIPTDQVFPDRVGEIYHLVHHPAQRWYYAPEMTRDELLLIKSWDSLDDGRARFTPHTAFDLPNTPAGAAPRESIELRSYVIIE